MEPAELSGFAENVWFSSSEHSALETLPKEKARMKMNEYLLYSAVVVVLLNVRYKQVKSISYKNSL